MTNSEIIEDPKAFDADCKTKIEAAQVPTEEQMRDEKVEWPKSIDELNAYIKTLVDRPHNYGTCCYAMSNAAVAAFRYVAHQLGVTGFQASCAELDFLAKTRGWKWGRILDYEKLLYPQYCNEKEFPSWQTILADNAEKFAEMAKEKLADGAYSAHPNVKAHWERLASI